MHIFREIMLLGSLCSAGIIWWRMLFPFIFAITAKKALKMNGNVDIALGIACGLFAYLVYAACKLIAISFKG